GRVRRAIHSVFLYHAVAAGMDRGIVNAGELPLYDDVDPELREAVEDVILNRKPKHNQNPTERLVERAPGYSKSDKPPEPAPLAGGSEPVDERLKHALVHGITDYIDADTEEARLTVERPLHVIEG